MAPFLFALVTLLWHLAKTDANYVRGRVASDSDIFVNISSSTRIESSRELALLQGKFQALSCNKMLTSSTCAKFTAKFGERAVYSTRVKVDCGVCYWMDVSLSEITFADGLEVNGRLVFMDGRKITVKATSIVVQGILEVTSTKQVDGTPDVKFVIIGGAVDQFFAPLNENKDVCGGNPCNIGARSIAVAGGQVKLNGLPNNTPSWVRLFDVLTAQGPKKTLSATLYDAFIAPPSVIGCPSSGVYINEDFSLPNIAAETFGDTGLAEHSFTGNAIKIFNRQYYYKGLQVDLAKIRRCLLPDQPYIITARVRLVKKGTSGTLTTCAQSKGFCVRFFRVAGSSSGSLQTTSVWTENIIDKVKYDVPFYFTVPITFSAKELSLNQTKQVLLWLDGPATDTDIFIEYFRFEHPPASTYPDPKAVCANLIPGNGGAEDLGLSPFPLKSSSPYVKVEVVDDPLKSGNSVFSVTDGCCGLSWSFPVACLQKRMQLRFLADFWAQKDAEITVRLIIQRPGGSSVEVIAVCSLQGSSSWQTCDKSYTVPDNVVQGTEESFLVRFDSVGAYMVDNISLSVETGPPIALLVENTIMSKWGPGSEIVVTSHTKNWDDYQLRTVTDVSPATQKGYVVLTLSNAIKAPTTMKENPDFAVEVALLSRNIMFDAEIYETDPLIGGHFWILYTPKVLQSIVGVEIKNFGQAGTLGRYPIHFHHSDDVSGSIIAKNSIRQSNQRCIIVHGTNNLLIQENVAFDTHGHCYMLEDGIETGNKFLRNLGIATKKAARLIKAQSETDNAPSTFWITNPQNIWIDNVAAGSEESGFWFELQKRGDRANEFPALNPKTETVTLFQGNVAHSNVMRGIQTYKPGYLPNKKANFTGLKVYRNHFEGIFLHETINVVISDSIFADNEVNINVGLADYIEVRDSLVIGESGSYRKIMQTQGAAKVCYFGPEIVGIRMHTFTRTFFDDGATFQNVAIENFTSSTCKTKPLQFDGSTESGLFHWPTSARKMNVVGATGTVDFCQSLKNGVTTAFLIDLDGGLRPSSLNSPVSASTLISNHLDMTTFVKNCVEVKSGCHQYCANTCFRSARFFVSPAETENLTLRICQTATKLCRNYKGYIYSDENIGLNDSSNRRVFPAYLPKGLFTTQFVGPSGQAAWPTFVETRFDRALCPDSFSDKDISLLTPSVTTSQCTQLIRHGNAEMSATKIPYWLQKGGGVQLAAGKGRSGSNAISDVNIDSTLDQINQHLDSRCMKQMKGRVYEISAWVRLFKQDGSQFVCDPNTTACPSLAIITSDGRQGIVGRILSEGKPGAFQLMHGIVTIGDHLASDSTVILAIERNRGDVRFMVDDVSMTVMPQVSSSDAVCKSNMVLNGNFNTGDDRFWIYPGSIQRIVEDGKAGNWALEFTDSRPTILSNCFVQGASYTVSIKFKMFNGNGNLVLCGSPLPCPSVYLFTESDGVRLSSDAVAKVSGSTTATGWNQLKGQFTASASMLSGTSHTLWFSYKNGYKLLIDDVVLRVL